jgi:hypothetical protein
MVIVVDQPDHFYRRVIFFQPFAPFFAAGEKTAPALWSMGAGPGQSGIIFIAITAIQDLDEFDRTAVLRICSSFR